MKHDASKRPAQRSAGPRGSFGHRLLKVGLAFVTAALLLNLLAGSRGLPAVLQARRAYDRDERALDRLKAENAALRREVHRLRMDASAVEEAARRDLGYIAPGEKVFIITDVTPPDATSQARPAPPAAAVPAPPPLPRPDDAATDAAASDDVAPSDAVTDAGPDAAQPTPKP